MEYATWYANLGQNHSPFNQFCTDSRMTVDWCQITQNNCAKVKITSLGGQNKNPSSKYSKTISTVS